MKPPRLLLPLLFILSLLSAQQFAAVHALHHALADLAQQQHHDDQQLPHSETCWKCAAYAQFGSALNVAVFDFRPPIATGMPAPSSVVVFRSIHTLTAAARGPPYSA